MKYATKLTEQKKRLAFVYAVVDGLPIPAVSRRISVDLLTVTRYLIEATCYNANHGIGKRRIRWQ